MNQILEVEIERILPGGVGLAHAGGATVFVPLSAPGDRLRVRVEPQQGKVLFASIEEVVVESPKRIQPPCPYFGRCGGCDFQQMDYATQLSVKSEIIRDCLHRITKLDHLPEIVVTPSPDTWNYRGRATWQIDREEKRIGYYERGSRRVCDVADCAVLSPDLQQTLTGVRNTPWISVPPDLKHLEATVADGLASLSPSFANFHTIELRLKIGDEVYHYDARAFFQVNQSLLVPMIEFVLNGVAGDSALDLYCGVGLFTLPLARKFRRVVGVESGPAAIKYAKRNIQRAQLTNVKIVGTTVSQWVRDDASGFGPVDYVLLDTPRAGAETVVINGILGLKPKQITYVSCDPATLARDLKKLIAGGYVVDSILAFDTFPQTHHVETVVHLKPAIDKE